MIRTMLSTLCLFVLTSSMAMAQCSQQLCQDYLDDASDSIAEALDYLGFAGGRLDDADILITHCEDLLEDFELFCPVIAQDFRDEVETLRASHTRINADIDREIGNCDDVLDTISDLQTDVNNWANLTAAERAALCTACGGAATSALEELNDAVGVYVEAGQLRLEALQLKIQMEDAEEDCYGC